MQCLASVADKMGRYALIKSNKFSAVLRRQAKKIEVGQMSRAGQVGIGPDFV